MSQPDTDLHEITFERVYQAPRELVFECMTTPEHLTHFWGPPGMSTPIENITIDLRVGGAFDTTMVNDETGEQFANLAEYVEIDPPARLAFREKGNAEGMTTTIDFIDQGDGTTLTITHQINVPAMFASPEAQAGMRSSFDRFDGYLAALG